MTEQNGQARGYFLDQEEGDPLEELALIVSGEKQSKPRPEYKRVESAPAAPVAPAPRAAPANQSVPVPAFEETQDDGDADSDFEMELMSQLEGGYAEQPVRKQAPSAPLANPAPAASSVPQAANNEDEDDSSLEDQLLVDMGLAIGSEADAETDDAEAENSIAADEAYDVFHVEDDFKATFEAELAIDRATQTLRREVRVENDEDDLDDFGFVSPSQWDAAVAGKENLAEDDFLSSTESRSQEPDEWQVEDDQAAEESWDDMDFGAAFQSEIFSSTEKPGAAKSDDDDDDFMADVPAWQETKAIAPLPRPAASPPARRPAPEAPQSNRSMFSSERELDDHFANVFAEELALDEPEAEEFAPAMRAPVREAPAMQTPAAMPVEDDYDPDMPLVARRTAISQQKRGGADQFGGQTYGSQELDAGDYSYEDEYEEYDDAPAAEAKSRSGGFRLAAIALGLALVVGLGAVSYGFFKGSQTTSEPVIVKADTVPVKEKPEDPGGATVANQDQAAYDRVSGKFGQDTTQEKLVTTTEEPLNLASSAPSADPIREVSANSGIDNKAEARLSPGEAEDAISPITLQPRRVQTVTVRRDGTIISPPAGQTVGSETAFASPEAGTAENSQSIDGAQSTGQIAVPLPRPALGGTAASGTSNNAATRPTARVVTARPAPVVERAPAEETPIATTGANSSGLPGVTFTPTVIPVPSSDLPTDPVSTQSVNTATTASLVATEEQAPLSEWVVQISSQRTPEAAQASYQNLLGRFPMLEGRKMAIRKADLDDRGTFYRVRIQSSSKDDANSFCQQLRNAGGSCFVTH